MINPEMITGVIILHAEKYGNRPIPLLLAIANLYLESLQHP